MTRYIDADAIHKFVDEKVAEGKDGWRNGVPYEWAYALTVIDNAPTADVVPKSEVDKDIKVLTKEVAKRKAMILDAIDTFRNLLCIESFVDYEDTRKHYVVTLDDVDRIHEELKQKYTEGEPNGQNIKE